MLKKILYATVLLAIIGGLGSSVAYKWIFGVNTKHEASKYIHIPSESSFEDVVALLESSDVINDAASFERVAGWMKYNTNVKPGRYELEPELSNRALISLLRSGRQAPVKLTFSTARTIQEIAGQAAQKIEADSMDILMTLLDDDRLKKTDSDENNVISSIIPNTYEVYWNSSAEDFADKMEREYELFWNKKNRLNRCKELGMTPREVSALASIVEKESIQKEERPTIAGVYLNRLEQGIHLQADPTVVFAIGDFTIRRVLLKHLEYDSPYNTYKYAGLPPGPICMPSISSIDAVLFAEEHDYIFFCAKPGYNGTHAFAKTNADHERNARIYHRWLNTQGIKG